MMTLEKILVGVVGWQEMDQKPGGGEGILFKNAQGIPLLGKGPNAVLVVFKPEENAKEVAETILWALR